MIYGVMMMAMAQLFWPYAFYAERYELVSPPSAKIICPNRCVESHDNDRGRFAAGMARRNGEGRPVVYRFNFQFAPAGMQHFIDLHECAHHQTGDMKTHHPETAPNI